MKKIKEVIKNEAGASMLMVIVVVAVALSSVFYVVTEVVPKLNTSVSKSKTILSYKVFVSSLNDYIVHGIRERWCLHSEANDETYTFPDGTTHPAVVTNMLVSNDCSSQKSMEEIVTYKANLERILWDEDKAIGSKVYQVPDGPDPSQANTILALNYLNRENDGSLPQLGTEDIKLENDMMILRIKGSTLADLTRSHPLYPIVHPVRSCIDRVDVLIEKELNINNVPAGDEEKFSVAIEVVLKENLSNKCKGARIVESKAYYAFYPRRNHTFALMKYGNLQADIFADYHGPVYVAGDLVLPDVGNKAKSSLFLNTVTLGIYDDGDSERRSGKIVKHNGTPYTFSQRGHPFKGKQSYYDEIRGIFGGLRLDGQEDKGFVNLFDHNANSNVDITTLELCVDEQTYLTTPSANSNSEFLYKGVNISSGQSFRIDHVFTLRNRFEDQVSGPELGNGMNGPNNSGDYFLAEPTLTGSSTKANLEFKVLETEDTKVYRSSLGRDSLTTLKLKLDKFGAEASRATTLLSELDNVLTTNWQSIFDDDDIYKNLTQAIAFKGAATAFMQNCDAAKLAVCDDYGYSTVDDCTASCPTYDDVDLQNKITTVKNKITAIKNILDGSGDAEVKFEILGLLDADSKTILNKQNFKISLTPKLSGILKYIDFTSMDIEYTPYHYGTKDHKMRLKLSQHQTIKNNLNLEFAKYDDVNDEWNYEALNAFNWYTVDTNTQVSQPEINEVIELECPEGIGVASWGLDMSGSTNFAWNYANTPPGVVVENTNHDYAPDQTFSPNFDIGRTDGNTNLSIVGTCTVAKEMEYVYGFFVCEKLIIESGRSKELRMIGTFIVKNLDVQETIQKVHWHSIWDEFATDKIITDLKSGASCDNVMSATWKDIVASPSLKEKTERCSPQDLVEQGPNNMTWTTIDPDIGIANPNDVMTSQKVKRFKNFIVHEISRIDNIK